VNQCFTALPISVTNFGSIMLLRFGGLKYMVDLVKDKKKRLKVQRAKMSIVALKRCGYLNY